MLVLATPIGAAHFVAPPARAQEAESARPEVAKPLQAAEADIRAKKFDDAQTQIAKAAAVKGLTPYESYTIEQTRAVLAQGRGDTEGAIDGFTKLLASGRVPASERARMEHALGSLLMAKPDYPGAAERFQAAIKAGDKDPTLPGLIAEAHFAGGDYKAAQAETRAQIDAGKKTNQPPTERQLQILANCALKLNDDAGYAASVEQLALYYPNPDVWGNVVNRVQTKPGVAQRYPLELFRLRRQLGLLTKPTDYEEMAQLAIADGFPGEAQAVIAEGFQKGVLGQPADAARQKRLKDYADRQLAADQQNLAQAKTAAADAHDGGPLIRVGYDMVTEGSADGVALIEQGIKKGNLPRPEQAKLTLATAYLKLGRTQDATAAFKSVQGTDGAADIAHVYLLSLTPGKRA